MEFLVKNKTLAITVKMHLARISLAKTFLQSYQGISAILRLGGRVIQTFCMNLLSINFTILYQLHS